MSTKVSANPTGYRMALEAFNLRTGYKIGSKSTRGIGLSHNPRIVEIPQ